MTTPYRDRIVALTREDPRTLVPNKRNPRLHPPMQRSALRSALQSVGWVDTITINQRSGRMIDGHARLDDALDNDEPAVPVLWVDLDDNEEAATLASFDPIGALATTDPEMFGDLVGAIDYDALPGSAPIASMLADLAASLAPPADPGAGDAVPPTDYSTNPTLAERFGVVPFSVLDTRQQVWAERKRAWMGLGIRSELGRGEDHTYRLGNATDAMRKAKGKAVTLGSLSGRVPDCYEQKRAAEAALGRKLSGPDFERGHLVIPDGSGLSSSGTSTFDPVLCEMVYRWFCPPDGRVLDPFAGGSVRGVVAAALGRRYTGVELSEPQVLANRAQWDEIGPRCAARVQVVDEDHTPDNTPVETARSAGWESRPAPAPRWVHGDSLRVLSSDRPIGGGYDLLFSCPPYADLEVYSDDPADLSNMPYPIFVDAYRRIIDLACSKLAEDRFAVFVVGEVRDRSSGIYRAFVTDTILAFQAAGLGYYNEMVLVTTAGSLRIRLGRQFDGTRKVGKVHQNVLVFVKGNPRRAADAVGRADYGLPDLGPDEPTPDDTE